MFYYPSKNVYYSPARDGYKYEEVSFNSKDGTMLSGWFIPAIGKPLGTVIQFHGNAQNMTAHYLFVSFLPQSGYNLFVFDYRGYGKSLGKPSHEGVYQDSVAAIKYIKSRTDIDQNKILVVGQSLGGANAIAVVGNNHFTGIRGMVIESTFYSYEGIAKDYLNDTLLSSANFATSSMVSNSYSPADVIDKISPIPIVFIHGTGDSVIPYKHSQMLFDKAKEPKYIWTIRGGDHVEAFSKYRTKIIPKVLEFFETCLK